MSAVVFGSSGRTPPRRAMVVGGRKRVECSWRGEGREGRGCHEGMA